MTAGRGVGLAHSDRREVYLGDEDGDVAIFEVSKEKKPIAQPSLGSSVYSTAVPRTGRCFWRTGANCSRLGKP